MDALETRVGDLEAENAAQQQEIEALEAELETHAGDPSAHHVRYSDDEGRDAVGPHSPDLSSEVADLQGLLVHFSREGDEITIAGANLNVVNGLGATETTNGLGNLIVGYNLDSDLGGSAARTGSHVLVVGDEHAYTASAGIVAGWGNAVTGDFCAVLSGWGNEASGWSASVLGGGANVASGVDATVSGGYWNEASGDSASVSGGDYNLASGLYASVSGGGGHHVTGQEASVSGGAGLWATGLASWAAGGASNRASGVAASVVGGDNNEASGNQATVSGGQQNTASGRLSTVSGGDGVTASGVAEHPYSH
jgi:hypothetical protein